MITSPSNPNKMYSFCRCCAISSKKKSDEFQDMEKGEFMDCYRLIDRVNKMCTMKKCRDGFLVKIPSNY